MKGMRDVHELLAEEKHQENRIDPDPRVLYLQYVQGVVAFEPLRIIPFDSFAIFLSSIL